jgi:signal transduction histidine kinase
MRRSDAMTDGPEPRVPFRWIRSFYVRIALTFMVFVVAVIVAQSLMFSYVMARRDAQDPARSPNNVGTTAALDVGAALASDAALDIGPYVERRFGQVPWSIFVVLKDGRVAGNGRGALSPSVLRSSRTMLDLPDAGPRDGMPAVGGPVITVPIQVRGELRGLVVMPPPPPRGGVLREVGRLLSLPGTLLLVLGTGIAALVIFAPARRRLHALEAATERLAQGDLSARAPEGGGDEIAHVARSFNRMAGELAARDEALRASDQLRRQMLADVSHELKTPLTSMRGYIETLQMPELAADTERRARYFGTIERETRRLERIVSDLLALARYENGVVPAPDMRVFSIQRLFEQVAARHECDARDRNVTIGIGVDEESDQLTGDPDRLDQVIDNLVGNALRYTSRGGTVELRAAGGGAEAQLSVLDSGEGIAPEHLPHVFDRFYKVDPSRGGGSSGSGLGLSIVKAIVDQHGGRVSVTSVPGRTEFTIRLPQPVNPVNSQGTRHKPQGRSRVEG